MEQVRENQQEKINQQIEVVVSQIALMAVQAVQLQELQRVLQVEQTQEQILA